MEQNSPVTVIPIAHATAILAWNGKAIYIDPIGPSFLFEGQPEADIVLVTDIHHDHFDLNTLRAVIKKNTKLIVPQVVMKELPQELAEHARVVANGEETSEQDFKIIAVPMYNIPEAPQAFHVKGRGNGYLIERNGFRVYVAGDTSDTPEMRALKGVDIAFVPMNLPYTMDVEEASRAVLAFEPKKVYPYHYRGTEGLSDVNYFKELVEMGGKNIEVLLLNWYPVMSNAPA